ncbi:hypothetical protein EWM62_07180 [Mucilaginibacter terrigena]|uniref:Uncharacterized protein n=1 Tax=Mucilaginibacter terrigena TaxID=2492395 RepID=A0A4Q5LQT3_9SPHI|nr:hypothetical protein [Mucilaginibacter terrigena]RYU91713.1 hypothetical protein EWM62_07180 [Mucilaginibacter terrigena]
MSKGNPETPKRTGGRQAARPKPNNKARGTRAKAGVAADAETPDPAQQAIAETTQRVPVTGLAGAQNTSPKTTMEVHHHSQSEHTPKSWKGYLLEGFMIFIAVTMGFIAESIRENITNREHVRHLTSQLVQDLKTDIAQLDEIYKQETLIVKENDSLFDLLQIPLEKADTKKIQQLIAGSHTMYPFRPSGGAMEAIKKELQLKQFSNSEIINHIAGYEFHIKLLQTEQDINLQYQHSYLDPFLTRHFTPVNLRAAFNQKPIPDGQMRDLNQADVTQLAADIALIRVVSNQLVIKNRKVKEDAVKLLEYVVKQYDVEAGEEHNG